MIKYKYYIVALGVNQGTLGHPDPERWCGHKHKSLKTVSQCKKRLSKIRHNRRKKQYSTSEWFDGYILGGV